MKHAPQIVERPCGKEVGMTDAMVAVEEILEAIVDAIEHGAGLDLADLLAEQAIVGLDLAELETAAQRDVEECDRAVGRVHRSEDVEICWNAERWLGDFESSSTWKVYGHALDDLALLGDDDALVRFDERD